MSQRFKIEDLVVQDSSGVVFRAMDTETNQPVALRRFFPFGANGGGLDAEEQIAYQIAVGRLSAVSHPALRSVISGGCDSVDGMPFIATEWIEGTRLQSYIDHGPLTAEEATRLLTQALEVCQLLSEVLAEEAVWVETGLQAIVVGTEGSGRGVTFWIAPLKWLGKNDGPRGLESIIHLTEALMGWKGKTLGDQAGDGLGGWLNWLRRYAGTTSLHEAREMLAASVGVEPPLPAKQLVRQATRRLVAGKKKSRSSSVPTIIIAALALIAAGLGGALLLLRNSGAEPSLTPLASSSAIPTAEFPPSPYPAGPPPASSRQRGVAEVNLQAAEMTAAARKSAEQKQTQAADLQEAILKRNGVFSPDDSDLLAALPKKEVILEGVFTGFAHSGGGAMMYLQFSNSPAKTQVRGAIKTKEIPENLTEASLAPLVGRKIRIHGKVQVNKIGSFPLILIDSRNAINVVE